MKNKERGQSGQALIELIMFLPLMFTLYSLISGFAGAINGSINQQKISRAYFYYRIQNNSTIPKPDVEGTYKSWKKFGMFYIGWKDYFKNESPVMPCYRISIPLKEAATDKCDEKYSKTTSQFIRVGTVYGFCGATYNTISGAAYPAPDYSGLTYKEVVDASSCLILQ
ncbi:MAG TPA: hypothetical protein VNJ01_12495 [Bacteriovoracaceae bacterium]|nr:hypothetical protein [Bacteriovoracaceae bacterium]